MNQQPLISVIVPVYKVEPYLNRCVDSILAQTYRNLEIILVDDGSPDCCGAICDAYALMDSRIKVIHQENSGISAARNAGLDICNGEYVCFVDSDDYIRPGMYEIMIAAQLEHQVDICVCQWQYEYSDGRQVIDLSRVDPTIYGKMTSREFARFLFKGAYENGVVVASWNKLYKRDIFLKYRFTGRYLEDDAIHSLILSKEYHVFVLDQQYYIYVENPTSLTHQNVCEDSLRILDIMAERVELFYEDPFVVFEAKKTYCNLYIEYSYKVKNVGLHMPDRKLFIKFICDLVSSGRCSIKFVARMVLFLANPAIYHFLLLR